MTFRAALPLLALLLWCDSTVHSEEPVRSTQEELRRRNLYFGDIDGRRSTEYEAAVKQYQKRKGFAASGKEDPDTLRSLGLLKRDPNGPAPKELEWPEEPVLKSDTSFDVQEAAQELGETTGIAPAALAPVASLTATPRSAAAARAREKKRPGVQPAAALPAAVGGIAAAGVKIAQTLTPVQVAKLVGRLLRAVSKGDLQDELSLYADKVDYYGKPGVDRRLIERQLSQYYALWPTRSYKLAGTPSLQTQPRTGEIVVTYTVKFSLKNARSRVNGTTENRIVLNAATSSPRIVSIQERRVRH